MSKQDLRHQMPVIAAIVNDLREAFGPSMINQQIRKALQGEPTFWATEAGIEFGHKRENVDIPIIDGRGIFFSLAMPEDADITEWLKKVEVVMKQVGAKLKAASDKNSKMQEEK